MKLVLDTLAWLWLILAAVALIGPLFVYDNPWVALGYLACAGVTALVTTWSLVRISRR